jgi:hypothetical protein
MIAALMLASGASAQVWPPLNNQFHHASGFSGVSSACTIPSRTFTADRFGAMLPDRMQIVAHYDGSGASARLEIELRHVVTGHCCSLTIALPSQSRVFAGEFEMFGYEPTGDYTVTGAVPNGIVDGVAFGIYGRSTSGERYLHKSRAAGLSLSSPTFMGGYPMAWTELDWDLRLPATLGTPPGGFTGFVARRQAQMTLAGAQLLPNGSFNVPTGRNVIFGDLDGSGCVDTDDLNLWSWNFGLGWLTHTGTCPVAVGTYTPDRWPVVAPDRMQVVAAYDGNGSGAMLDFELWNPTTLTRCTLTVPVPAAGALLAIEYQMNGFEPTGEVEVRGVVTNGGIDGVAFGLYFRDAAGDRCVMRSESNASGPDFAGGWPIAWSEAQWDTMLPAGLGTPPGGYDALVARRQAQMTLSGARFLQDGVYRLNTCAAVPNYWAMDVNGDGIIDLMDLQQLMLQMGQGCCP